MPRFASLDLSAYGSRQPDLFLPALRRPEPGPSVEDEHLAWARAQGFTPEEIIASVGEAWELTVPPNNIAALVALIRARRRLERRLYRRKTLISQEN